MTCKDCIYYEHCHSEIAYGMGSDDLTGEYFTDIETRCKSFKNKADVVSREVFEQVKWERDTALQTLQEHGIGLGEKTDFEKVVRCKNCIHSHWEQEPCHGKTEYYCPKLESKVDSHFYCALGEKKEGAEE